MPGAREALFDAEVSRNVYCVNVNAGDRRVGLVLPKSPETLSRVLADVIEDAANELPRIARLALQRAHLHWIDLELQIAWCDERIAQHVKSDARAQKAAPLHGIGPLTASALVATVGDFAQFRTARQFGAWLGLVPRQNSTGGKASLGGITNAAMTTCACC